MIDDWLYLNPINLVVVSGEELWAGVKVVFDKVIQLHRESSGRPQLKKERNFLHSNIFGK